MKIVFTILGSLVGLFAALLLAGKSIQWLRKHIKRYISVEKYPFS